MFIPTQRANPANEPLSRQLLQRAGYLRGTDCWLPLAQRSIRKINVMARDAMDREGALEIGVSDSAAFEELARELRSYNQLPQTWYAIGQRLEARRFSLNVQGRGISLGIAAKCGLPSILRTEEGKEDWAVCSAGQCAFQAPIETASTGATKPKVEDPQSGEPEPFHTPGRKTIAQVAEFVGLPETSQMKSLVMVANGAPFLVLVRGDHQLSEAKFAAATGDPNPRPARPDEIFEWFGAGAGSLGPVGVRNMRILIDSALQGRQNMICGANRDDYHLRNVTPGRDFQAESHDLRLVAAGDPCYCSSGGEIAIVKAMSLERSWERELREQRVTNDAGQEVRIQMSAATVWLDRFLTAIALTSRDTDGLIIPAAIAPFDAIVTPVNWSDETQRRLALEIYQACSDLKVEALLDDRDERAGVKFKDADLIGVPFRITVGKRAGEGVVEVVDRRTKQKWEVAADEAPAAVKSAFTGRA